MERQHRRLPATDRRQQILRTASMLFIERGFEVVSMSTIAEALGIARPTVYSYFPTTAAILEALLDAAATRLWAHLDPLLAAQQSGSDPRIFARLVDLLVQDREALALLHCGGGPIFRSRRRAILDERLAGLLLPYIRKGRGPYLLPILVTLLEGTAFWAVSEGLADTTPLAETIAVFIEYGLAGVADAKPCPPEQAPTC